MSEDRPTIWGKVYEYIKWRLRPYRKIYQTRREKKFKKDRRKRREARAARKRNR